MTNLLTYSLTHIIIRSSISLSGENLDVTLSLRVVYVYRLPYQNIETVLTNFILYLSFNKDDLCVVELK